ncbi:NAD(P)H-dependent oxidoreductase [Clostridium estertheticum]|uniref:flavodoxin family protein n=1 Tax=Clostridium estertheticum TaxID=238834 RepID=UPI0013E98882|nr:NAD(P)H-dependent oxidoreductase [Clostridium estertheticum]MBZ9685654.1 NAD(P)H-dependent oxidoreductase [Clostridium estertheticum]
MKTAIIFHSVCGNTYLVAKAFYESFLKKGKEVEIYRVWDENLEELSEQFSVAKEYLEEIMNIPIAKWGNILDKEQIILGCPTYYGNVSAEMKAYMDAASEFWADGKLIGKRLTVFTSAGSPEGGGHLCLQALNTFGQHMGMILQSIPPNLVPNENIPAYGMIHYSGALGDQRPGEKLLCAVDKYVEKYL